MTKAPRIRVRGVCKRYPRNLSLLQLVRARFRRDHVTALSGVDVEITTGGIWALLGPNGAGKTTLLKSLAGLLLPDAGTIAIDGVDLTGQPARLRGQTGLAVCDERSFYWRVSARENLRFFASLNGLAGAARERRVLECLELVGLADLRDRRFMELSAGMRQSLALARGLLLDPPILLMDEPTRSLDPEATARIHDVIAGIRARDPDRVFLYSTHDLAEAESISDGVMILRRGRMVTQRSLSEGEAAYVYGVRTSPPLAEDRLDHVAGVTVLGRHGDETTLQLTDLAVLDAVVDQLRADRIRILEVRQKRSRLAELYRASAEVGA